MNIYFSASRFYKKEYSDNYQKIISVLEGFGGKIYDGSQSKLVPMGYKMPQTEKELLYKDLIKRLDQADICVFEASYPSTLHIGHEITMAIERNKPVIVLHVKDREPILFKGLKSEKLWWIEYSDKDVSEKLLAAIDEARRNIDVRFNFFVSPKILSYLDWVAKNRMIPRSVFLRNLIEREMKKDKEFKG